jgi:prolyl-tRNA editing enzyme YbaK/EbsC (Cys-tRNA(Pro) deacylase)
MAGDGKVDNAKFKSTFNTKAKMIPFEEVESVVGYAAGGVCPFGINEGIKVYLDESLRRFDVVYPAAGTAASAVKLSVDELVSASEAVSFVDVAKLPV